ncbi:MAG: Clp1/GlmU family protein [Janthinobacterium lividum]
MAETVYQDPQTPSDLLPTLMALPQGATVLLLGASDTGKTTWVRDAARMLTGAGRSAAIVDCDLGQSEIGSPGTIGTALASPGTEIRSLRDLPLLAAYFIGATSPPRHLLDVCVGAVQMARVAKKKQPGLVLVDTDGFIGGSAAQQFKRRLCELLLPQVVIAFTRGSELDPLLTAFAKLDTPEVWRIPVGSEVQNKTAAARTTRRAARFLAALDQSEPLTFSLETVALQGTALGTGDPLPHHLIQFLSQSLGRPALHAERTGGSLYVVVNGERWDTSGLAAIEDYFGTRSVTITAAQKFAGLLVGLVSSSGVLLGIGRIDRIDFPRRTITVLTPCRKPGAVAQIWFGSLRLKADGRETGEVRPGEI